MTKLIYILLLFSLFMIMKNNANNELKNCWKNRTNVGLISLIRLEGTSVSFECNHCLSKDINLEDTEWLFNSSYNSNITKISVETFENAVIKPNKTLNMHNLDMEHSGHYWCTLNDTRISRIYILYVDNGSEPVRIIHLSEKESPKATVLLIDYNLKVYSDYTDWSACSKCDQIGEKIRYGYCTISSMKMREIVNEDKHFAVHIESSEAIELDDYYDNNVEKQEIEKDKMEDEINDFRTNILPKFENKIPCRSKYTPTAVQNIPKIKERESEMIIESCQVKCKKNAIFEIRDKLGRILERANNSAGIYSMLQGVPEAIPMPVRITLYREFDTSCELKCPGLNSDTPVTWKIGLKKREVNKSTSDRIHVNKRGYIVIKKLRYSDNNIYSCWQENELSGTIRLKVTKQVGVEFNRHLLMLGAIVLLSVFSLLFWRAFKGRKRFTKR